MKDCCLSRLNPETGGVVNDTNGQDEWRDLGSFECEAALLSLLIKCNWKDQGRGARTGHIRARLMRGETVVSEVDVFGPCGRRMDSYGSHVYDEAEISFSQEDEIVGRAAQGDTISFSYNVGAQGAQLHIQFFEAEPEYNRAQGAETSCAA